MTHHSKVIFHTYQVSLYSQLMDSMNILMEEKENERENLEDEIDSNEEKQDKVKAQIRLAAMKNKETK